MKSYLKKAREQQGLRVRELANKLGIDQALVSKFESGQRIPTRKQIFELATALEISAQDLLSLWLKEKIKKEIGNDRNIIPGIWSFLSDEPALLVQEPVLSYNTFKNQLEKLDSLKNKFQGLRNSGHYRIAEALELEFTYESNRIEGNTLTLHETNLVINQGLTISGKSMREHLEAINHQEAIAFIKDLATRVYPIRERDVMSLHNLILRGIDSENAGRYRRVQVMISGSSHVPPAPFMLPEKMNEFFSWLKEAELTLHPVVLAAEVHQRLVSIHPFIDGNGRTSRLLMNLILLKNGYVIANIKGDPESRTTYYNSLESTHTNQNNSSFIDFIINEEIEALKRYLKFVGA